MATRLYALFADVTLLQLQPLCSQSTLVVVDVTDSLRIVTTPQSQQLLFAFDLC